jgi:hypothetical protein
VHPEIRETSFSTAMKAIRFERPLPLLVEVEEFIYDLRVEFDEGAQQWRVATFRFGLGFGGWLTLGKDSIFDFQQALSDGIELAYDQPATISVASELVAEGRASVVEAQAA